MTNQTIPPCPVCGVVPVKHAKNDRILLCGCFEEYGAMMADVVSLQKYQLMCVDMLGRACRELGIETVEQVRELVGIACDACDERTVRATNRAENLVPLLRRRAGEGWR